MAGEDGSGSNASDGKHGSGGNVSDGEQWGAAEEASLIHLLLISCCAVQFLTGCRLVPGYGPGVGDN